MLAVATCGKGGRNRRKLLDLFDHLNGEHGIFFYTPTHTRNIYAKWKAMTILILNSKEHSLLIEDD